MGKNVSPFVGRPFFTGNQYRAVFTFDLFDSEAADVEVTHAYRRGEAVFQQGGVFHGCKRLPACFQAERSHFAHKGRNVAPQAKAGAEHQKQHDDDKPDGGVNVKQAECLENPAPKRAEFDDVVGVGQVLLQNRADDRGDA